ncbi:MAG: hypothetical protein HOJ90_01810 [Alphaproteobacteria bacterium]|jgi:quercetin dioxygenase-like cupin family protein|nr:hypothetical protein [Alphaproteobacteria bacterium]
MSDVQLARFSDVSSQGARFAEEMGVPLGAYQKMTAEEFFLVMSSPTLGGPFATDPGISEDQGLIAAIVKCSPGQGPYLHAHYNTLESFTCLSGKFRITWGDEGENETFLDTFDTIAVPRGVVRTFASATDDAEAHILGFIRGDTPDDFADVAMMPAAATDLDDTFGPGTSDKIKDIGWRFDAGEVTPNLQVSPADMETCIARFADITPRSVAGAEIYAVMHPDATQAAITGDRGEMAQIIELAPGAEMPAYARSRSKETLMCLTGDLTLGWGPDIKTNQILDIWDTVTLQPGITRRISNSGSTPAYVLSLVIGSEDEAFDDVMVG